jgi:hypothetical protein
LILLIVFMFEHINYDIILTLCRNPYDDLTIVAVSVAFFDITARLMTHLVIKVFMLIFLLHPLHLTNR